MRHHFPLQAQCSTHPKRFWVLLTALIIIAVAGGGWTYMEHRAPSLNDQLHGDSDSATNALGTLQAETPDSQKLPQLLRLMNDPQPGTRAAAADALAAQSNPAAISALEQAYQDSSAQVRSDALENLPKSDPKQGKKFLLIALKDEDSWMREQAVGELRRQGDKTCVTALIQALGDPDPAVPHLAQGDLATLTGQKFAYKFNATSAQKQAVIGEWRAWWTKAQPTWPTDPAFAHLTALRPTRMDPAPNFQITDTDGHSISLEGQKGRVTLLNFWGTWCPPCQQEIPDLVKLDSAERSRGLDIVGIALAEDSTATLRQWCSTHGVQYRQAMSNPDIQEAYGNITEVPVSVMIDKHGQIRYRWEGPRDLATFRAAADRLIAEP